MPSRRQFCFLVLCCLLLTGCSYTPGSDRSYGSVKLMLTSSGKPLTAGFVQFTDPADGKSSGVMIDENGLAEIDEVVTGRYQVLVLPPTPEPGQPDLSFENTGMIPEKYQKLQQTPLQVTIEEGSNELSFDLL